MSAHREAAGERYSLAVVTAWFSEFRTRSGLLVMLEIPGGRTTFGRLCAAIAEMPGIEFADMRTPVRLASGAARFRFRGQDYEVSMPHTDYRVRVLDPVAAAEGAAELLLHLKLRLMPRRPPLMLGGH